MIASHPGVLECAVIGVPDEKSTEAVKVDFTWHFTVFRATADSAGLTISDWREAAAAGGPAGQELLYDFVQVQPYDAESK